MTLLGEKLKDAGADTIGAKFTTACTVAARLYPNNPEAAWRAVGQTFGYEFMRSIMADMNQGNVVPRASRPLSQDAITAPFYQPKVISPERLENRRRLQEIVRSKYKNSAGVAWSDVGWHELASMHRDGKEASALLEAAPAHVPNDGRNVGQVLGVERVDKIIQRSREG